MCKEVVKCHDCLRDINLLDEELGEWIDSEIGLSWYFCKDCIQKVIEAVERSFENDRRRNEL